jgi:hypothetical protein
MLVIDGKYNSGDGRIRRIKSLGEFGRESSGGTTLRKTRATKLKIQEFAEEREDRDPVTVGSHSNFPKGRQPSDLQKLRGR